MRSKEETVRGNTCDATVAFGFWKTPIKFFSFSLSAIEELEKESLPG